MIFNFIHFCAEGLKRKLNYFLLRFIKQSYKKTLYPYSRYDDVLSDNWYLHNEYEAHINNIIAKYGAKKYHDFFIDIGANLGFTTISNYQHFNQIFCFEPNEIVYNILKSNTRIHCNSDRINLFNVGLGATKGTFELKIPRHNFGGAFIEENNRYDIDQLLKKDGFNSYNEKNFLTEKVTIEDEKFFKERVLSSLKKSSKGVIKIDVEGYEMQILELILKNIDCNSVAIIFECLNDIPTKDIIDIINKTDFTTKEVYLMNIPDSPIKKILTNQYKKEFKLFDPLNKTVPGGSDIAINLSKNV
tara:strand:+ start:63 stop:968 length:906 start_codon:yes stop_codon:yes gene_type:complete